MKLHELKPDMLQEAWEEFNKKVYKSGYFIKPRQKIEFHSLHHRGNVISKEHDVKIETSSLFEMLDDGLIEENNLSSEQLKTYKRRKQTYK